MNSDTSGPSQPAPFPLASKLHQLKWFSLPLICFPSCSARTHTRAPSPAEVCALSSLLLPFVCFSPSLRHYNPPPCSEEQRASRREKQKEKVHWLFFWFVFSVILIFPCFVYSCFVLLCPSSEVLQSQTRDGMWTFFAGCQQQKQQRRCRWERLRGLLCMKMIVL